MRKTDSTGEKESWAMCENSDPSVCDKKSKNRDNLGTGNPDSEAAVGYRSFRRLAKKKKRKRRILLITVTVSILAIAFLVFVSIQWPNFGHKLYQPFKWMGEKVSSLWTSDEKPITPIDDIFFHNPINGQEYEGRWINTLSVIKDGENKIHALLYTSFDREDNSTTFFWIPEGVKGKSSDGKDLTLAESLRASGGKLTNLRTMVESMVGEKIHFIIIVDLADLTSIAERLMLPAMIVENKVEVYNPFTGEEQKMYEGQNLKDKESLLAYLLAEREPNQYRARVSRGSSYFPEMFKKLREKDDEKVREELMEISSMISLTPSPKDDSEKAHYLTAMINAWGHKADEGIGCLSVPEIEILNGCGTPGAGLQMKERFEAKGFEVAEAGKNAKILQDGREVNDFSYDKSVIVFHSQERLIESYTRYLAVIFSIGRIEYREGDPGKITMIVGSDLARP